MSIYLPNKIKVGYQNRKDTYSKKLAYIIYYDEKGKLRKETSWRGWIDEKMGDDEFENTPLTGFVLNKDAGDYDTGWDHRKTYCRVYDPRGFEIEIDVPNLLYILQNTDCSRGKGLEGEFVYGWDGTELVLIPVGSPDYKELKSYSEILNSNQKFSSKNLIKGVSLS